MCFSVFFRTFVKPFRVLPSYCNTKISEISDLTKSRTTYVAKGLANMINYSVAETRFDMNIIDSVISTEATRHNVRLMLPIMIHWAKTGQNKHTYGDLTHAIGKPKPQFSGIGHALYCVQEVLNELAHITKRNIPTLNSLCKNAKTMLPSEGFEFVSPKYNSLDDNGKRVFVEGLDSKAINYPHWDWVLKELNLEEAVPFTEEQLEAIKNPHCSYGGEGEEHKGLKEYICQHPECLDYKDVTFAETEHILPSGDRLDVYFELSDGTHVAIEVKPSISPDQDITRGIFQCIKYYAVMDALKNIECKNYNIEILLVTAGKFSSQNKILAEELNVEYVEKFEYE